MDSGISLRTAQDDDREFCFAVTERAMRLYEEQTFDEWNVEEQRKRHLHDFAANRADIVSFNGEDVGIWSVVRGPTRLVLNKIYLLPEIQRQSIASSLLDRLIRESGRVRLPIHLRLPAVIPVRALYERKGFRIVRDEHPFLYMERPV